MVTLQSTTYDNFDRIRSASWQNAIAPVLATGGGKRPAAESTSFRNEHQVREWVAANTVANARTGESLPRRIEQWLDAGGLGSPLAAKVRSGPSRATGPVASHAGRSSLGPAPTLVFDREWATTNATGPAISFSAATTSLPDLLPAESATARALAPVSDTAAAASTDAAVGTSETPGVTAPVSTPSPAASPPATLAAPAAAAAAAPAFMPEKIQNWTAEWRSAAAAMPCGSCTGRACSICSIRIGGKPAPGSLPSGYSPRILQYYKPDVVAAPGKPTEAPVVLSDLSDVSSRTNTTVDAAFPVAALAANNAIVIENQKQGTPENQWMIGAADSTIEGYAAQFTLNHGQTVDFKINTDSKDYKIEIYRLGYYGGDGARRITTINKTLPTAQVQPIPLFDPATNLVDAGNWSVSASWAVPADAVSGIYFARLTRNDGSRGSNIIPFIVRDDEHNSDITFQTSDTTWQAYNWWGGYNLYGGVDVGGHAGRATKVSYNRPIITRDGGFAAGPQDFIFGAEYPAIRWLEQNGYDVNYISGIDTARDAAQLLNGKVFLSIGHDEYWSAEQRNNVEAARDAGVNLAFLSGNEVYWQTRWETSIDGTGTPYKTLVSYKERWDNEDTDVGHTTSTWRDPQLGAGKPENGLTGTIFTVDSYRLDTMKIPYDMSNFRFWSNTAVANLQPNQVYSLTKNLLGYEWDSDLDNGFRPAGLVPLSSTTVDVQSMLLDYGNTVGAGTANHSLTLYRAPSGALVFGAGTVYWVWGLDDHHDNEDTPVDPNVQQAMVNLFADMGVQPATLMASLQLASQTTDHTAPVSAITSPTTTGSYQAAKPVVITGTATDSGGGLVAVVEVSTDNGQTWHRATGYNSWTYSWTPLAAGNYTIKTRAVDDSINLETPGSGVTITVAPAQTVSLFPSGSIPTVTSDSENRFVSLGMRFSSTQAGSIAGIKYYKGLGDGGTHVGSLWTSTGTLLGSVTFNAESASGWQTATFTNPIPITAGTTYVVSYNSQGHFANTPGYFTTARTNGPLTAPVGNGYYTYGNGSLFPTTASNGTNYWVDVIYTGVEQPNTAPVANNDSGYVVLKNSPITIAASALLANDTDANGDALTLNGIGASSGGVATYNATNGMVTFTPTTDYVGPAQFGYSISDGRGGIASAFVNLSVAEPASGVGLFGATETPTSPSSTDASKVTLGVRFVASAAGTITGLKYYKSVNDTGTHVGSLWTSTGQLLATATFANESASGWQTVTFGTPVSIAAGTTYVASYHSNGYYASSQGYFATPKVNGPLSAGTSNGVYTYGATDAFPTSTYSNTNYWVDVLYLQGGGTNQPPTAVDDTGLTGTKNTPVQITAAQLLANDTDPNGDTLVITGVGAASNGTVSYDANTKIVTFTPTANFTGAAGFNYTISDGRGGQSTANAVMTITTAATGYGLFPTTSTPATVTVNDSNSVELGTKFTVGANGSITGIRFYKGPQNTGTHTGRLWSSNGTLLGTLTFNNETASGWQTASFVNPIQVTAGTSYVVSYHTNGFYSTTANYFGSVTNGALSANATGGNGVYAYGSTPAFPTNSWNNSNYWVDVVYDSGPNQAPVAVSDSGFTTKQDTALQINASQLLANDTDANSDPLNITAVRAASNGTASYNATTKVVTFTPAAGFTGAAQFTYDISDGSLTSSANVSLTVAANAAPVAANDSGFTTKQDTALQINASQLLANDTDANGDPLNITAVRASTNGTVSYNATTKVITFTPTAGYTGAAQFTYDISDGSLTSSANVSLTVAANAAPVAVNDSGFTTVRDTAVQITAAALLANDSDPNADPLTITGVRAATNGTVSYNATTKVVTFTPTAGYTGAAQFTYDVSDGLLTSSANVALTVTASAPTPYSLFAPTDTPSTVTVNDRNQVELGMKFTASANGQVTAIKFYKGPQNVGTHTGSIWSSTGTRLGTVTFNNETASGWQTAQLTTPVSLTAGQTYVVSYHTNGFYSANERYFNTAKTNGPLTAPTSSSSGGNGVYAYGASAFPTSSYNASNYWVDVVFNQLAG